MKRNLLALLLVLNFQAFSQSVQTIVPDSSFSGDGILLLNFYNNIDRGYGVAIQPDQKIVMVGLSQRPATGYFELCFVRLNTDGTLDTTFSSDGYQYVSLGNQQSIGGQTPTVKLDSQGRIVAVNSGAFTGNFGLDILVCRLLSDGSLDNTFGVSGIQTVDMTGAGTQPDLGSAFDFDIHGNIYIVGACRVGFSPLDNDFALVKIDSSGTLSNDFDQDGKKLYNPTGFAEFATGVVCLPNGRFVFGGKAGGNVMLIMMDSTGALVSSFNGTGMVTVPGQSVENPVLALDSNGRILLGVSTSSGTIQISRYLQNGSADAAFGFNSSFVFNNSSTSVATSIGFQSDQKIIVGGYSGTSTASDFLVFRLDTTGTLDLDFNTTGFKTQPLASSVTAEEAYGMGIMSDDRILLAGTIIFSSAVNEDVGIVMLKVDSVVPSTVATINSFPIQLYPNPFDSDGFVLDLTIPSSTKLITEIHDVFGRLVFTRNDEIIAGSQQIRYNNLNLSKGFYTVSCFMSDSIIGNFKVIAR
ncbi:MAG: hypothetical protein ACKOX7_07750 [Bacteroidota bacterium]